MTEGGDWGWEVSRVWVLMIGSSMGARVSHRYRFTHSASKMGAMGMGTVLNFGIPQHTAYLYHSVMGIHVLITYSVLAPLFTPPSLFTLLH
jgi:hypothetical protein